MLAAGAETRRAPEVARENDDERATDLRAVPSPLAGSFFLDGKYVGEVRDLVIAEMAPREVAALDKRARRAAKRAENARRREEGIARKAQEAEWRDAPPVVCPGCHAVGEEPCAIGCDEYAPDDEDDFRADDYEDDDCDCAVCVDTPDGTEGT